MIMSKQPDWETVYCTDYSKLRRDRSGVYEPELVIADQIEDGDDPRWAVFTIVLDRCYDTNGVLSDNQYHLDHPAWFADKLDEVAESLGTLPPTTAGDLRRALCSNDAKERDWAYESIGGYFGYEEFDEYPDIMNEEQLGEIL